MNQPIPILGDGIVVAALARRREEPIDVAARWPLARAGTARRRRRRHCVPRLVSVEWSGVLSNAHGAAADVGAAN